MPSGRYAWSFFVLKETAGIAEGFRHGGKNVCQSRRIERSIVIKMNTEQILEFDKIKELWMSLALTEGAKEEIRSTQPCMSESGLLRMQRETSEARMMMEKGGNPPLVSFAGIGEYLMAAEKGDCLNPGQLEETGIALVAVMRLKNYLERCKQYDIPLAYYAENLDALEELKEQIQLQIRGGRVDDGASRLLKSLRSEIERVKERMREKADAVMRANKACMSDSFSTIRNGHICIPVKKEYKFKISGSVIDKSATGNTLFIEPSTVAKYAEELQSLQIDAENEERRILYTLTAMLAEHAETMRQNRKVMEKLDYIFSKGKLSMEYGGVEPEINTDRKICLKNARHPLMDRTVCVPLQFEIGNKRDDAVVRGIVITGPNTGGKTVAIKTVALNCMMAQCGLHVAAEEARICMNSSFLCDIGDGQNLSENLSTFSAHITNVLDILRKVNSDSLVIMDELGSGTDPTEGMGIAIAILKELKKSGALFLVTTHYPEVKQYAEQEENVINARMTFDRESLRPLYQMIIGEAGESCALYIARQLGMPDAMLQNAVEAAYGKGMQERLREAAYGTAAQESLQEADRTNGQEGEWRTEEIARDSQIMAKEQEIMTILSEKHEEIVLQKESMPKIQKCRKESRKQGAAGKFCLGDSVMVYPDRKIGIVCQKANEKGVLRVQMPDKKIWINHKRIKLYIKAEELYPEDYDFSILFDTVGNRKLRHQMEKRHVEGEEITIME